MHLYYLLSFQGIADQIFEVPTSSGRNVPVTEDVEFMIFFYPRCDCVFPSMRTCLVLKVALVSLDLLNLSAV